MLLFGLSMASYCSIIFIPAESRAHAFLLMPSKALGFTLLIWAAKNKLMKDWEAFSAKRSQIKEARRAKIDK